jgi:hypothetical protein
MPDLRQRQYRGTLDDTQRRNNPACTWNLERYPHMTKRHFEMIAKAIEAQSRIQYAETALQATRLQTLTDVAEHRSAASATTGSRLETA